MPILEEIDLNMEVIIDIATVIIISITAYIGLKSLQNADKIKKYQIIKSLKDEYSNIEMYNALQIINDWILECKTHGNDFGETFLSIKQKMKKGEKYSAIEVNTFKNIDKARRKITHFMSHVKLLYDNKIVSRKELAKIISKGQIDFYLEKVKKLEVVNNTDNEFDTFFILLMNESKIDDKN